MAFSASCSKKTKVSINDPGSVKGDGFLQTLAKRTWLPPGIRSAAKGSSIGATIGN